MANGLSLNQNIIVSSGRYSSHNLAVKFTLELCFPSNASVFSVVLQVWLIF